MPLAIWSWYSGLHSGSPQGHTAGVAAVDEVLIATPSLFTDMAGDIHNVTFAFHAV